VRVAQPRQEDPRSATVVRACAYAGAALVITALGAHLVGSKPFGTRSEPPVRPAWTTIERPFRAFASTNPDFPDPEGTYAIQRHAAGGGRKDVMTWDASADGSHTRSRLKIEIYRPGTERQRFREPAVEVAALIAELPDASVPTPSAPLASKFGRIAAFDFVVSGVERSRNCLGFVRDFKDPPLQIAGWYCAGSTEIIDRTPVTCALERLTLQMAASEPKVIALFARAELQRKPCGPRTKAGARTASPGPADWIEAPRAPKLRGRFAEGP
jgi:hypothetical protein